jgi:endonuclease/exonuclease/phosphatase (EEP) superfamily protein YafD
MAGARWGGASLAGGVLFAAWAVGQLARDATLPTALLFYVPSPLVALTLAVLAGVERLRRRPALALALAALAPLAVALLVECRWRAPAVAAKAGGDALRVLHWNVSGGWVGAGEQAREIARRAPDFVVLSEAPDRVARRVAAALPGFRHRTFGSLSLLARELDGGEWVERSRELQVVAATLPWGERRVAVLAVNLISAPLAPRAPSLARVAELLAARRPDLAVGDFNAPRRSWALRRLPAGYRHAYDEAGSGWSATWPVPLPLLAIDQAIIGPELRAVGYRLAGTAWSDHRLQVIDHAPASR